MECLTFLLLYVQVATSTLSYSTFFGDAMLTRECFSGGRYDNSEIGTSKCFFWYLRTEVNGGVMISFVALDEQSSLVKYKASLNKFNCTENSICPC